MRLFNSIIQEAWFEGLPGARIPYGDRDKMKEYFKSTDLAKELTETDFIFFVEKILYIEWCLEQESKGMKTDSGRGFDHSVFEKFVTDEMQYEFERSTIPDKRSNRGTFYETRHRVLEAFVKNAVLFLEENKGIDGVKGNYRNLRTDLRPYLSSRDRETGTTKAAT